MKPAGAANTPYWRRTVRLSVALVALWIAVVLCVVLFGPWLDFGFFGWPFGFWVTAQGALLVFCAIVWFYAFAMDRLERRFGDHADDD